MRLPLNGVRIADLTHAWAGPHCTTNLADLGAEVIKLEPPTGDMRRGFRVGGVMSGPFPGGEPGEKPWNRNIIFNIINRNKRSISLNLGTVKGNDIFKRIVKISDVVIENLRPGALSKYGVDYEVLKEVKPDIIVVHMSGYGHSGPWMHYRAFGVAIEPMCGFFSLTGYPGDSTPIRSGVDHLDPLCGAHAAGAILAALLHRHKTGKGQCIDLSYLESGANFIGEALLEYTYNHRIRGFIGNRHPYRVPQGCYRCKGEDEWVVISVGSDEDWKAFCQALGNPSLVEEERFAKPLNRLKHQDNLDQLIETWTSQHNKFEVMDILQNKGIAAGAVLNMAEVYRNEQLRERGFLETVTHPEAGIHECFGPRFKFSRAPLYVYCPAPPFATDTDYVLGELLGISDEEIEQLVAQKVIFREPELMAEIESP